MANVSILGVRWLDNAPSQTKRPLLFFRSFTCLRAIDRPPGDVFPLQFPSKPIEKKQNIFKMVLKLKSLRIKRSQMNAIQHTNLHFTR